MTIAVVLTGSRTVAVGLRFREVVSVRVLKDAIAFKEWLDHQLELAKTRDAVFGNLKLYRPSRMEAGLDREWF